MKKSSMSIEIVAVFIVLLLFAIVAIVLIAGSRARFSGLLGLLG